MGTEDCCLIKSIVRKTSVQRAKESKGASCVEIQRKVFQAEGRPRGRTVLDVVK